MQTYDKKHCVPFTEILPEKWKTYGWVRDLFLREKGEFCVPDDAHQIELFKITYDFCSPSHGYGAMYIMPQLCSELFWGKARCADRATAIFFFVNDSWFLSYFKKLMQCGARLRGVENTMSLYYIGH